MVKGVEMKWKMISLYFRLDELAALEKTVDVPIPPHVIWDNTENITLGGEGATYYEQYTIPGTIWRQMEQALLT